MACARLWSLREDDGVGLFNSANLWSPPQGRHKPHCWLTNRTKAPAAITTAIRTPMTNDVTGWRLGLPSFDLAPFCAAPMPNQKRSLSIDRRLPLRRQAVAIIFCPAMLLCGDPTQRILR